MKDHGGRCCDRRSFLQSGLAGLGAAALAQLLGGSAHGAEPAPPGPHFAPRAKRAIWLFMGGGPSQLDLFDYKPGLRERFNQDLPDSVRNDQRLTGMTANQAKFPVAPSRFGFEQAENGAWVSELLPWTRQIAPEIAIVKTVSTESINHELAMSNINTGSQLPGKPSVGAWLSYGLGRVQDDVPTYAVMTSSFSTRTFVQAIPTRLWGSAFLPASHGGIPMRGVGDPVLYLPNPAGVPAAARRALLDAVGELNALSAETIGDPVILDRSAQYELAFRMQSSVPGLTDLSTESAATLDLYGSDARTPGSFAANCVAARRMLEKGVRFVQIYHRGWDAHVGTPANHISQCRDVDQACYGLIRDLSARGMLEDTLVIWGGEFGRTVYCQGTLTQDDYGRDHHPRCFSMWLAGGGVRPGIVHGETDDFGYNVVDGEVPLRDLHATLLHLFGLDPNRLTFRHAGLAEKLTGVGPPARVVTDLIEA